MRDKSLRFLLLLQLGLTLAGGALVWGYVDSASAFAFWSGGGLSLFNLGALTYSWPRILAKKQVALAIAVIVFKFAILGWFLYFSVVIQRLNPAWFSAGFALVIVSVVAAALRSAKPQPE